MLVARFMLVIAIAEVERPKDVISIPQQLHQSGIVLCANLFS
jgi:hypothetical protein